MSSRITEDQAYAAMFSYLNSDYERSPSDGVGALLGSMSIQADGKSADPAAYEDWLSAVRAIRDAPVTFVLRSPAHSLEGTGLHDATLDSLNLDWETGEVVMHVRLVGGIAAELLFHSIKSVLVPRHQPWGRSASINAAKTVAEGMYELEMQSGDLLRLEAQGWSLKIGAAPGEA